MLLLFCACNDSVALLLCVCNVPVVVAIAFAPCVQCFCCYVAPCVQRFCCSVALLLRERYLLLGGECCFLLNVAVNNVNATMRNNRKRNDEKGKFGDI